MTNNLIAGWLFILLGLLTGALLGIGFDREEWLGGYTSVKRRLYRLGHISLVMLGVLNVLFALTARALDKTPTGYPAASWLFVAGAIAMPIVCMIGAHVPKAKPLFALPILFLCSAVVITLIGVATP